MIIFQKYKHWLDKLFSSLNQIKWVPATKFDFVILISLQAELQSSKNFEYMLQDNWNKKNFINPFLI